MESHLGRTLKIVLLTVTFCPPKDKLQLCSTIPFIVSLWFNSSEGTYKGQLLNKVHILVMESWAGRKLKVYFTLPLFCQWGNEVQKGSIRSKATCLLVLSTRKSRGFSPILLIATLKAPCLSSPMDCFLGGHRFSCRYYFFQRATAIAVKPLRIHFHFDCDRVYWLTDKG